MSRGSTGGTLARWCRVAWAMTSIVVVQAIVLGLSLLPVVLAWVALAAALPDSPYVRAVAYAVLIAPSYVAFALCLMVISALATWCTGARTPEDAEMRIADLEWPLLRWVQYQVATHLVRWIAGSLFRSSPIWTVYLRMNGARIGHRVYVNSLFLSDHNLIEIHNDVIIGSEVHLSGHTVEAGILKTGRVRIGSNVTIGLGSVIDIDVVIGDGCQVGALSVVPKHARLEADTIYAGIPARNLRRLGGARTLTRN